MIVQGKMVPSHGTHSPYATVRLRLPGDAWGPAMDALIDTGATWTMASMEVAEEEPGLASLLAKAPVRPWRTADGRTSECRIIQVELGFGTLPHVASHGGRPRALCEAAPHRTPATRSAHLLERWTLSQAGWRTPPTVKLIRPIPG